MTNSLQFWNPCYYLGFRELHYIVADIIKKCQWVNSESSILGPPDLVQELGQLQHTPSRIHSDENITVTTKSLHHIGCERKNITD